MFARIRYIRHPGLEKRQGRRLAAPDLIHFKPDNKEAIMASWKCQNCGYTFEKDVPPEACPSCKEKCEFVDNTCYTPDCVPGGTDPRIK